MTEIGWPFLIVSMAFRLIPSGEKSHGLACSSRVIKSNDHPSANQDWRTNRVTLGGEYNSVTSTLFKFMVIVSFKPFCDYGSCCLAIVNPCSNAACTVSPFFPHSSLPRTTHFSNSLTIFCSMKTWTYLSLNIAVLPLTLLCEYTTILTTLPASSRSSFA